MMTAPFEPNDVNRSEYWQANYDAHQLPWDTGSPTPAFRRQAESGQFPVGRMLVVGAGSGHDARLFARHGFEVTALDFAPGAVALMQSLNDPAAPINIQQADLFALPPEFTSAYDYVLEYKCFCAIDPRQRPAYAVAIDSVLRPGGRIIALVVPINKGRGGPPFEAKPDEYMGLFTAWGYELLRREIPTDSVPPRQDNEELVILRKPGD